MKEKKLTRPIGNKYHIVLVLGILRVSVLFYVDSCLERTNDAEDRGMWWTEENKTGSVGVLFVGAKASQA